MAIPLFGACRDRPPQPGPDLRRRHRPYVRCDGFYGDFGDGTRLTNHTTTLATEYAKQGRDWEVELRQRAREVSLMNELGLGAVVTAPAAEPAPERQEDEEYAENETEA